MSGSSYSKVYICRSQSPVHPTSPLPAWYPCLSESVLTKAHFLLNIWFRYHQTRVCRRALCGDSAASAALIWRLCHHKNGRRRGEERTRRPHSLQSFSQEEIFTWSPVAAWLQGGWEAVLLKPGKWKLNRWAPLIPTSGFSEASEGLELLLLLVAGCCLLQAIPL